MSNNDNEFYQISDSHNNTIININGRPKDKVWQYFTSIDDNHRTHKGAVCTFCSTSWKRGKPQALKTHLALHCKARIPREIRIEYLHMISEEEIEDTETTSTPISTTTTHPNKKIKSKNNQKKINTYFDSDGIDDAKIKRVNQALIRWFVCSGIPFVAADSPFFIDFTKSLCYGYNPPHRTTLSESLLNSEIARITLKIDNILKNATNLTLCVDGWSSPLKQSIYSFVILLPDRKQYIYSIEDSHTSNFNAEKIIHILEQVGPEKFTAIVTDAEAAMMAAKRIVTSTFPNILSIRCIAHHIQLIASDIVKVDWAKNTLQNIQKIITFFRNNYRAGSALRDDIIESLITGGYLKTTVKTRWSTAWDACESMIHLESSIKSVLEAEPEIFRNAVNVQTDFFKFEIYKNTIKTALTLWKQFGGGAASADILRTQMSLYKNREPPFQERFVESVDNVRNWWNSCELRRNEDFIRVLALKLAAITPHNGACECIFSILSWYTGKRRTKINVARLESMAKIHSFLITNARSELKFVKTE
ncbi:17706_t:CDS:2, partial [Entrophospora sp. SA101]